MSLRANQLVHSGGVSGGSSEAFLFSLALICGCKVECGGGGGGGMVR